MAAETFSTQTRTTTNLDGWQIVSLAAGEAEIYADDGSGLMMFRGYARDLSGSALAAIGEHLVRHIIEHACAFGPGPRW